MKNTLIDFVLISAISTVWAKPPDCYQKVESVDWVVSDLDAVAKGWTRLGFARVKPCGEFMLDELEYRGRMERAKVRAATANIGGFQINWIQPVEGRSAYSDFLAEHGNGVFSLNHLVSTPEALSREISRVKVLGIEVLQTMYVQLGSDRHCHTHLDTEAGGKYVIGLLYGPQPQDNLQGQSEPFPVRRAQYAFVVRKLDRASRFWSAFGMEPMEVTHPELGDLRYRGRRGFFDQKLGWQRHGSVTYEWIEPLQGPTVYREALEKHGEGFHHFAFEVDDLDKAVAWFASHGILCSQSGNWGEQGKPGSGRFAYLDTDSLGGVTIELLWNFKE